MTMSLFLQIVVTFLWIHLHSSEVVVPFLYTFEEQFCVNTSIHPYQIHNLTQCIHDGHNNKSLDKLMDDSMFYVKESIQRDRKKLNAFRLKNMFQKLANNETLSIVVFGGSFTLGRYVGLEQAWPNQVQLLWNTNGNPGKIQIHNLAVGGTSSGWLLRRLLNMIVTTGKVDAVILDYDVNDCVQFDLGEEEGRHELDANVELLYKRILLLEDQPALINLAIATSHHSYGNRNQIGELYFLLLPFHLQTVLLVLLLRTQTHQSTTCNHTLTHSLKYTTSTHVICKRNTYIHSHSITHSHTYTLNHTLTYTHPHTYIHTYIHTYTHPHTHSPTHSPTYPHTHPITYPLGNYIKALCFEYHTCYQLGDIMKRPMLDYYGVPSVSQRLALWYAHDHHTPSQHSLSTLYGINATHPFLSTQPLLSTLSMLLTLSKLLTHPLLSTHPLDTPYYNQHRLSTTHTIYTPSQHTLSTT